MPITKKTANNQKYIFAVGRRRESVARIRLYSGKGETLVNDKPISQYFPILGSEMSYLNPFKETGTLGKYFATIRVVGGGFKGQLGAVVHGLSRALSQADPGKHRSLLKKKGLLTRDPRTRERRKVGTGGKARRKKQSPKR
ncbi:MAG: 30S ribosomal protein S9 [bacterium]|nr:30S ribosomal protein S9 [bacterium]